MNIEKLIDLYHKKIYKITPLNKFEEKEINEIESKLNNYYKIEKINLIKENLIWTINETLKRLNEINNHQLKISKFYISSIIRDLYLVFKAIGIGTSQIYYDENSKYSIEMLINELNSLKQKINAQNLIKITELIDIIENFALKFD